MLADIQQTVYPDEVTRQLHVMPQARESSPVIDRLSHHCATNYQLGMLLLISITGTRLNQVSLRIRNLLGVVCTVI